MGHTFFRAIAQDDRVGLTCVLTAYFSILLCAAGSRFGSEKLESFAVLFALCVIFAALMMLVTFFYTSARRSSTVFTVRWIGRAAIAYILALLFVANMFISMVPASAWDVLSYWSLEVLSSMPNDYGIKPEEIVFESHKHPWMISGFLASSLNLTQNAMVPGQFWFGLLLLNVLCSKSLIASLRLDLMWFFPVFFVFFTPLVENHFANFGYAEMALCLGFNIAFCLFHHANKYHSAVYGSLAILVTLSLILIKTSGPILCIICLVAFCGSYPKIYRTSHIQMLWFSGLFCVGIVVAFFLLSGLKLSILKTGTIITAPDFSLAISIFQRAFFENASFSVTALLSIFCFFYLAATLRYHSEATSVLCLLHILLGMATFLVLFIFTDYGIGHSLPHHDTSFSRLALPAAGAISFLVLFSGHVLQAKQINLKGSKV